MNIICYTENHCKDAKIEDLIHMLDHYDERSMKIIKVTVKVTLEIQSR